MPSRPSLQTALNISTPSCVPHIECPHVGICSRKVPGTLVPIITRTASRRWALTLYAKKEAVMKRILLAVSALAIAGAAALPSANASQGAYVGDCRVIRERIETRRTGQPARLRIITISVKAAIPIRANGDGRRNNGAARGSRAFAAEPVPRSASTPVPMSSSRPTSDAGQSKDPPCQMPCE